MKKNIFPIALFFLLFAGCSQATPAGVYTNKQLPTTITSIAIDTIYDLSALQNAIDQLLSLVYAGTLSLENAQELTEELQQKYLVLIHMYNRSDDDIESSFFTLQKLFNTQGIVSYTLPLWAKKLGMIVPQGMVLDKTLSKSFYDTGYASTILVYRGDRALAVEQAKIIAQKSNLHLSKNLQQAQSIVQTKNINYISGLNIADLYGGIVYLNHELLDIDVDQSLWVHVDQTGTLTIEATIYRE